MEEIRQRSRHIFQKDNWRFTLADDAKGIGDEVAGIRVSAALAGVRKRLAGRAAVDEIHRATKSSCVKGPEIAEDGSAVKDSIRHPSQEHVLAERVNLAVRDGAVARDDPLEAESDPFEAGAERERIHGAHRGDSSRSCVPSHTVPNSTTCPPVRA